ncbi:hypothetical protein CS369_10915 [Candidatus Symbiopectobacterium sp. 'North America']|uniref:pectinesterase family protein n=1 Tax=Candidatus Symbiopectobacterium sp. 'North America' TaxID=2794574 RepID=UPI0018CB0496|nr:hypothetical protein [Candidatus Symbiopectobacterium sp. 'North America']
MLSSDEAARFTQQHYFAYRGLYDSPIADAWTPQPINIASVNTPYVVGPTKGIDGASYTQIQDAVNAALQQQKGNQRIYIKVQPGTYIGTVYVPAEAPPITLFGAGDAPEKTIISLGLDSMISPATYRTIVNANQQYQSGDPAWYMYDVCASKQNKTIDTTCTAVLWSQSDEFQLKNLTVVNSLLDTVLLAVYRAFRCRCR